ncbi:2-hydroxy-3-oxopropionate reductase [Aquimixticola soesokkakensis]|uniref:2-hydroxy-3-oxopropionate reductase n=1 Tax=Aquimixticola soesokkakensis TaxID=1519096 RepID=A0A1Y5RXW3_9RHOB|nr:NAD(P)-dependent oxidoreductase [Aquimixticola soesokkakensis]SLN26685.1 2-hydroxy-3-oxopropionate reductase [Aquimixticola soesokkakensis]
MSAPRTIAVLGTGLMGAPMAVNLARAGHHLRLWNRDARKAHAIGGGTQVCETPAQAVALADIVVVMLSSGPVCEAVLFGDKGVAASMRAGAILVVMSSIGHEEACDMARRARSLGLRWIDAPVSGGTKGAQEASLSIMAGGTQDDVAAVTPVLSALGTVTHIGPHGSGALCKLANQMLVASTIAAVSEALFLAKSGGADPARVRAALMGGFANSRILEQHGARMIAGDFTPGGPAKYQVKDTQAALDVAQALGLELPLLTQADALFSDLVAHGGADLDHSALLLELERRNATPPSKEVALPRKL